MTARGRHSGFSLVEVTIALALMMVVTSALFGLIAPAHGTFRAQPEVSEMQQRMRIGADMLFKDLMMAGAGTYSGAAAGTLLNFFAPVLPYRTGAQGADPPLSFFDDRITLVYVPNTASQTSIASAMPQPSAEIKVTAQPGCPSKDPLCGFKTGMRAVIFDETGAFDAFTITNVQSSAQHLQHAPPNPPFSKAYSPGENARIAQMATHTYYRNPITDQLRHYDGYQTDVPLVDHVVGLTFRYFGDPNPPQAPRPAPGEQNCLFDAAGNAKLAVLPAATGSLVELTPAMLTDGPVCGLSPNTFDADLYRVRKIQVTLRVQAAGAALRGTDPLRFTRPGTATGGERYVPDYEMSFEVTPRNLNLAR